MNKGMRLYYDQELDYLTIFIGESKPNYGEDVAEGVTIFKDQYTNVINWSRNSGKEQKILKI